MNRDELVTQIAKATGYNRKETDAVVRCAFDIMTQALKNGEKVSLAGFGVFEAKVRAEHKVVNVHSKQEITVPQYTTATFRAGTKLKDKLNG